MKARRAALAFAVPALLAAAAAGAAWPEKRVTFVVPAPPGGTMDVMARVVGANLSPRLGQPVVVDHRPGGGGALAVQAVLDAAPDGHTLLFTGSLGELIAYAKRNPRKRATPRTVPGSWRSTRG